MTVFRGVCPRRVWWGGWHSSAPPALEGLEGKMGTENKTVEPCDYAVLRDREDDAQWTIEADCLSRIEALAAAHTYLEKGDAYDCIKVVRECPLTITIDG